MYTRYCDDQGNTISQAEWIRQYVKLTKAQRTIIDALRNGYILTWAEDNKAHLVAANSDSIPVRTQHILKLYENGVFCKISEESVLGPPNIYGKRAQYWRIVYDLSPAYLEAFPA